MTSARFSPNLPKPPMSHSLLAQPLRAEYFRSSVGQRCIKGSILWNTLPDDLKCISSIGSLKRTYKSCLLLTICITIDCVELLRHFHDQSHFVYITVVDVTTIVYRLLGRASLVCVYISMSVCLSVLLSICFLFL